MNQGDKLWKIFQVVWKVLKGPDLKDFGKALFFGTSFNKLGKGASRTVQALTLRIGGTATPAQVYIALASQAWGYGALKELGKAAHEKRIFRELSTGNQERLLKAAAVITWPTEASIPIKVKILYPKKPKVKPELETADPFESRKNGSAGAGMLVVVSTVAALMLVGLVV